MIGFIRGQVVEKTLDQIVIDVNGIGYQINATASDINEAELNSTTKFHTVHIVREQSEDLYGFSSLAGKRLFELLITVPGVGPKAGLAILGLGAPEFVRNAIASGDSGIIVKANGVGKKTAERVVIDLHDKVGLPNQMPNGAIATENISSSDEALEALIALGFTLNDASSFLRDVPSDLPTSERVKQALRQSSNRF